MAKLAQPNVATAIIFCSLSTRASQVLEFGFVAIMLNTPEHLVKTALSCCNEFSVLFRVFYW